MTIRRGPSLAALAFVSLLLSAAPAFAQWYKTYDEGVRDAESSDRTKWAGAVTKLNQSIAEAAREGKSPGPMVLRTSQDRRPFSPHFYLALVYNKLNRALEADAALQEALTRNEIRQNDQRYLAERKKVNDTLAANDTGGGGATGGGTPAGGTTGGGTTPPGGGGTTGPGPNSAAVARTQFDQAMTDARGQLTARRFDDAASAATRAKNLNIDNTAADGLLKSIEFERLMAAAETDRAAGRFSEARTGLTRARDLGLEPQRVIDLLSRITRDGFLAQAQTELVGRRFNPARSFVTSAERSGADSKTISDLRLRIDIAEAEDRVRAALASGNATTASAAVSALSRLDPRNAQIPAFSQSVTALMTGDAQRLALLAFYQGNYAETLKLLSPLAGKADAPARVYLYMACSRAALALLGAPNAASELESARQEYRRATSAGGAALATDRRYISPAILRALTTGG